MIGDFADHAHRIDLATQTVDDQQFMNYPMTSSTTSLADKLRGNIVILNVSQPDHHLSNHHNPLRAMHPKLARFDASKLDYNVIEKEILNRSQAMFDINQVSMVVHRRFPSTIRIRALQIVSDRTIKSQRKPHDDENGENGGNNQNMESKESKTQRQQRQRPYRLLVATDDEVFVYDLRRRTLSYSLTFPALVLQAQCHNTFLFVLTERDVNVYAAEPTENGQLLLLWSHPLLRMRGLRILNHHKFCLEFGSQTEMDRFSVNADGRRIRSHVFDLRMRIQSPDDPDKRPLTIFEENSPKNILLFEWAPTSEMVLSLITKSHEAMTQRIFQRSRHLLIIALELIRLRKAYLFPLYDAIKRSPSKSSGKAAKSMHSLNPMSAKTGRNPTNLMNHQMTPNVSNIMNQRAHQRPETVGKSLTNLISSAWNWMNTNPISSMVVGNASSLSQSMNALPKKSVIQSEWQMLKQLKKECHGLLADVYVMESKYDIAAQHYILSNRQFLQVRQLYLQHIGKWKKQRQRQRQREQIGKQKGKYNVNSNGNGDNNPVDGLTLFYRLFLEHKSRIDEEASGYTWNCMMEHFQTYRSYAFSTIFLHPFMLNTTFNLKNAGQWLDSCIYHETSLTPSAPEIAEISSQFSDNNPFLNEIETEQIQNMNTNPFELPICGSIPSSYSTVDPYSSICPSTVTPRSLQVIQATHYLAKVVLLCLKEELEAAQHTMAMMDSIQFVDLLQHHKRLWLEWSHSKTFRRLCCVTFPWEFARIVLDYATSCYKESGKPLKTVSLANVQRVNHQHDLDSKDNGDSDNAKDGMDGIGHLHGDNGKETVSKMEELFPLRSLNFNESLQYFEYQSGGPSLMQCYLEGAVRYLVEEIDEFEAIMIESNRSLPESDHALYMKYLAELEEIGFTLIELYVQYLQKVCYDDTTSILMGNMQSDHGDDHKIEGVDDGDNVDGDADDDHGDNPGDNPGDIAPDLPGTIPNGNDLGLKIEKQLPKRAVFERKRHLWNSQYPVVLRPIPSWLTRLLQRVQTELFSAIKVDKAGARKGGDETTEEQEEIDQVQNEQMMVMTRICSLLSCIEFGASITNREKGAFLRRYRENKHINFKRKSRIHGDQRDQDQDSEQSKKESVSQQWRRRLDLLLASCPDIPVHYVNAITIIGYVCCGCIVEAIDVVLDREQSIVTDFALSHCKTLSDWKVLLDQILKLIARSKEEGNDKKLDFLQRACRRIWSHLGRLSSLSTKQSEWLSVMDLISLVPDDGNLEFFAPIFSDLCRNQAGDSLNMELFDRIVQIEKDKDYGFNQQMHEIFYPQQHH